MKKILFVLLLIMVSEVSLALKKKDDTSCVGVLTALSQLNFNEAKIQAFKETNKKTQYLLLLFIKIIKDDRQSKLELLDHNLIDFNSKQYSSKKDKFIAHLILGFRHLNYVEKNRVISFNNYLEAYILSKQLNNVLFQKVALLYLLKFYEKGILQDKKNKNIDYYLEKYRVLCSEPIDWFYYYSLKINRKSQSKLYNEKGGDIEKEVSKIFISYDSLIKQHPFKNVLFYYYRDKANHIVRDQPQLAQKFYLKSKEYFGTEKYYYFHRLYNYLYLSNISNLNHKYEEGIAYINKAKKYISFNDSLNDQHDILAYKSPNFYGLKLYDSAYHSERKARFLTYGINFQKENRKVRELNIELNTKEKEKKITKQRYLLLLATIVIFLGVIIMYLSLKNSRKKRLLAEQEKNLEQQKNLTLLKEQEITAINAMIDGQEKERIRIAEDLHDNIGSVLATLKLHFENLQFNRNKEQFDQDLLFQKTETLIDEAYLKIRSIAHAKNSGVIANKGLLVAVKLMAEKISSANKININVIDFGLNNRLENSLEITLFRIIQELTTNVIKHAYASEININISQFENHLNLIIEDNGVGFSYNNIEPSKGMGLDSVEKRVEYLGGFFEVDSTKNQGTSIIIDLPLNDT